MERKLTAILSADVKGYSRLMGEDEEATIRTLTAYRQLIDTLLLTRRYEEAIPLLKRAVIRYPDYVPAHADLAII